MQKREQGKVGGAAGGAAPPAAKRGRPFGSGSNAASAAAVADSAAPSTLLGPSLQVHSSFADQNNKRIVLALQSGLKSELTWALNTLTLLSFKEKDEVRRDATPLAKIPGLLDALLQVVDDWRDIALPKELTKAPRTRLLGANSVVTGFGNEYEVLGSNDAPHHAGVGSGLSSTEASLQKSKTKHRPSEWWFDEDGIFNLDEEGRAEKQQCAVAASNIIRNFSFMPENEVIMAQHSKIPPLFSLPLPPKISLSLPPSDNIFTSSPIFIMASNAASVIVKNIAPATSDGEVKDFFSFCGKIADLKVTSEGETKTAEVTFEKETAKKTALLLNNTQLGPNQLSVSSAGAETEDEATHETKERDSDEITQEEKPRARILAEYLAHGYVVGDVAIERAIELDTKHKVSSRFVNTLQNLDQKYHATDRAKATDQSYGVSTRANSLWSGLNSYFEKASSHPTGKKLVQFYTEGSKQVQEVHSEARRLAELKKESYGGSAYKASGLERFFGKEKEKTEEKTGAAPGTDSTPAPAPAPSAAATTVPPEGVKPIDEKTTYA